MLLGAIFVVSGLLKAWDPQGFTSAVQNYQLTSWDASIVVGFYLPWLEVVIGVAVWTRRLYDGALLGAGLLGVLFLAAVSSAWWRQLDISCGCFGSETNHTSYGLHLFADGLLVGLAVGLLSYQRRPRAGDQGDP